MEKGRLISHAKAKETMRRAGYSDEQIEEVLLDLPDPYDMDSERALEAFSKHGVTWGAVIDRMGGSP